MPTQEVRGADGRQPQLRGRRFQHDVLHTGELWPMYVYRFSSLASNRNWLTNLELKSVSSDRTFRTLELPNLQSQWYLISVKV